MKGQQSAHVRRVASFCCFQSGMSPSFPARLRPLPFPMYPKPFPLPYARTFTLHPLLLPAPHRFHPIPPSWPQLLSQPFTLQTLKQAPQHHSSTSTFQAINIIMGSAWVLELLRSPFPLAWIPLPWRNWSRARLACLDATCASHAGPSNCENTHPHCKK